MKNWKELYIELSEKVKNIEGIEWVDLWRNQVGYIEEEHPFSTPAVFLDFRILNTTEYAENQQAIEMQIGFHLFYETMLDTYTGAYNQKDALEYLDILTKIHALFHGSSGANYNEMLRTGLQRVDVGTGHLYLTTFSCTSMDLSAANKWEQAKPNNINVEQLKI